MQLLCVAFFMPPHELVSTFRKYPVMESAFVKSDQLGFSSVTVQQRYMNLAFFKSFMHTAPGSRN